ncbi:MAG: ATP-dependent dethiobiotin synthetase BioD [Chlamydiia bacterium]|nr:ATP-dependent dethiobiotin synthetase BioD [Chlamydiia bacterium]
MIDFPEKLFIIGSDSGVGKTLVSAILTLGLKGSYIKPIQCGVAPCTDTEWVHDMTGLHKDHFLKEIYRFPDTHDPNTQHTDINISRLLNEELPNIHGHLIMESTGGVMVPIYGDYFQVDYIADLKIPTLLVIENKKGAINQALLSLDKLKSKNIPLFGIVLNGPKDEVIKRNIADYCRIKNIFELEPIEHITEKALIDAFNNTFTPIFQTT